MCMYISKTLHVCQHDICPHTPDTLQMHLHGNPPSDIHGISPSKLRPVWSNHFVKMKVGSNWYDTESILIPDLFVQNHDLIGHVENNHGPCSTSIISRSQVRSRKLSASWGQQMPKFQNIPIARRKTFHTEYLTCSTPWPSRTALVVDPRITNRYSLSHPV